MLDRIYLAWSIKYLLLMLHTLHFSYSYESASPLEQWIGGAVWAMGLCLCAREDEPLTRKGW